MTRAWSGVVLPVFIVIVGACTGGGRPPTPSPPSPRLPIGSLTAHSTDLRVEVEPVRGAKVLSLRLSSIDNPKSQDFALIVLVERQDKGGGRGEQEIGGVSPFPPNRPGTFILAIPQRARSAFSDDRAKPVVLIRLRPVRQGAVLTVPLRVDVESVVVRSSAPVPPGG